MAKIVSIQGLKKYMTTFPICVIVEPDRPEYANEKKWGS